MGKIIKLHFKDELRNMLLGYTILPIFSIIIILLIVLNFILLNNIKQETETSCIETANFIADQINSHVDAVNNISEALDIENYMQEKSYNSKINSLIYTKRNQASTHGNFYIIDLKAQLLFSTEPNEYEKSNCLDRLKWRILKATNENSVHTLLSKNVEGNTSSLEYIIWKCVYNTRGSLKAYLAYVLPSTAFEAKLYGKKLNMVVCDEFSSVYISNSSIFPIKFGKVSNLSNTEKGFINYNSTKYYMYSTHIGNTGLIVYSLYECGSLINTIRLIIYVIISVFIIFALGIVYSSKRFANNKTAIIDTIIKAFEKAQNGDLTTKLNISSNDEFEIIGNTYNNMLSAIRELMERNIQSSKESTLAKIKQLEAEFDPHFLFNTLENIRFMIRLEPKAAEDMILRLSTLLRYSIDENKDTVSLHEDMLHTESYLAILKYRFGNMFKFNIGDYSKYSAYEIPKLIMQPIIENSLKYGRTEGKEILVEIFCQEDDKNFIIEIRDNGNGMSNTMLEHLEKQMLSPKKDIHKGILNVHHRLKLMYGKDYGLIINSQEGKGTAIKLVLPKPIL